MTIELEEDITCLIGNNGAGKTSVLKALQRLFGRTAEERKIVKSDFHTVLYETDIKNKLASNCCVNLASCSIKPIPPKSVI